MKSMNKVTVLRIVFIVAVKCLVIETNYCEAMPNTTNSATMMPTSATPQQQKNLPQNNLQPVGRPAIQPVLVPAQQPSANAQPLALVDGPNTVDHPEEIIGSHGNWMKKKSWLLNSYKVNNSIQALANEVQGSRKAFSDKLTGINEKLDNFYKTLGLEQGKLDQLFNSIEDFLTKKNARAQAALETDHERAHLQQAHITILNKEIADQKTKLNQLKLDIKSITDLDKSLIDRFKKMDESISSSNASAREAQERIRILWDIIDDKKARIIYYELNGTYLVKINTINSYLKTVLLPDFTKVIELIETQITKAQTAIDSLEKEGLIIQQRTQRVIALKLQNELDKEQALKDKDNQKVTITVQQSTGWYNTLYSSYTIFITAIQRHATSLYTKISTWFSTTMALLTKKLPATQAPIIGNPVQEVLVPAQPAEIKQDPQNTAPPTTQPKTT